MEIHDRLSLPQQCRGFGDGAMISLLPGWRQHGLGRLSGSESIAKKATSSLRTFNMEEIWQIVKM
nr:hypothetical protein Iba_chr14cCG4240 [Ipomoea batatas]GME11757.1 hypothetical protein Iba_scaffold12306CG0010 [Ipomoea batatas]GME11830.1 hypothetical protein Iba_scaffold12587CG0060 [Ipomoea batatas]GME16312.1 hypothetical protein Iba_scaffold17342CG0010 [Ipomoea batatas]